jgi:hypothetical protein
VGEHAQARVIEHCVVCPSRSFGSKEITVSVVVADGLGSRERGGRVGDLGARINLRHLAERYE